MSPNPSLLPDEDPAPTWRHNVRDAALQKFRTHYSDETITKDDIHTYVYGVLHAPDFRERYAINLVREAPRVPLADTFWPFADIGGQLMDLHLNPDAPEHRFSLNPTHPNGKPYPDATADDWLIHSKMQRIYYDAAAKGPLQGVRINPKLDLMGIPEAAHTYKVGIHTPVEHAIRTLTVDRNKDGAVLKDANAQFAADPNDGLRRHLECRVGLALHSAELIAQLPPAVPSHIPPRQNHPDQASPAP